MSSAMKYKLSVYTFFALEYRHTSTQTETLWLFFTQMTKSTIRGFRRNSRLWFTCWNELEIISVLERVLEFRNDFFPKTRNFLNAVSELWNDPERIKILWILIQKVSGKIVPEFSRTRYQNYIKPRKLM